MQKNFAVNDPGTNEVLGQAMAFIHESLAALKLNAKDINRAELACEESLLRLLEHSDFTRRKTFRVKVRKFLGDVFIDLTVPGSEFDFRGSVDMFSALDDEDEDVSPDATAAIQSLILQAFVQNINYKNSRNFNIVRIRALTSNYAGLFRALAAVSLAIVVGLLTKMFVPASTYMLVNDNLFNSIRSIFMHGLKMCAVPIVFCSIAASASDMGNFSGLKRTGTRLISWFLIMQIIAVVVGFGLVMLFWTGKGAGLQVTASSESGSAGVSIINTIINIMPENIVRPFLEGNMLQLILAAFLAGTAAASTGAKSIITFLKELNGVFMKITGYLMVLMPLVIFCSIASMIITTGLNSIFSVLGVLLTLWAGYIVMNIIYCLALKVIAGLSPAAMYKKSLPVIITGFSTCSSNACIPDMMKSAEALGIPGATLICLSVILVQAGCPVEFLGLVAGLDILQGMLNVPTICMGNIACTTITAAQEKILDTRRYKQLVCGKCLT